MSAPRTDPASINDRIIQTILYAILVATPLALGGNRLWAVTPAYLLAIAGVCALFLRSCAAGATPIRRTPLAVPIAVFAALSIASFFTSAYPHASLMALYSGALYLGCYILIVNTIDSRRRMERLVGVIAATGALLSFIGLILYLGHRYYGYWMPGDTLSSTFMNRDHCAAYLEMAMPLAAALCFSNIGKAKKVLAGFFFIMMFVAFILAASRGAWVSLAASTAVLIPFLYRNRSLKRVFLASLVCAIVILFALSHFDLSIAADRARSIIEGVGVDDTRMAIWLGAAGLVGSHPWLGSGVGTFAAVYPQALIRPAGQYAYSLIDHAHNDYLEMAVEVGFVGLLAFLWIVAGALAAGLGEFGKAEGQFTRSVLAGAVIGVMSVALHSIVDFSLRIPANAILFTALIAIIMTMQGRRRYD